ncbi:mitochondrial transcription rescue factor 1-like [Stegodyphus dumicola]|uniref:mitochondrial transcription rescue factor 1-like n=1 Tax=Stegodyphus dumicola TaxID=202533 RepID=UPI0015AA65CB|nr:mitochondrial transcription rescue factor 1-like [Stegodyphus dumicola]
MFCYRIHLRLFATVVEECRNCRAIISVGNLGKNNVFKCAFPSQSLTARHLPELYSAGFFQRETTRNYAKKKKGSKQELEEEEESDVEDEEDLELEETDDAYNLVSKTVPSLRVDTVLKAGLGMSKKQIEKEFYASKIFLNGEKVSKKATNVSIGDEIDLVKGYNPDNSQLIDVHRVIIKSVGKVTGTGNYPLKMEAYKSLPIENYKVPWTPEKLE